MSLSFLPAGTQLLQQDLRVMTPQPLPQELPGAWSWRRVRMCPEAFPPHANIPPPSRFPCHTWNRLTQSRSSEQVSMFSVARQALSYITWTSGAPQRYQAEAPRTCQWAMLISGGSLHQGSFLRGSGHKSYQPGLFGRATCLLSPAEVTASQHLEVCAPLGDFP